jgi:hypothetical protein
MEIFGMFHQKTLMTEEDGSFEENLKDDKFVHNMSSEVRRDEHPLELHDTNQDVNVPT